MENGGEPGAAVEPPDEGNGLHFEQTDPSGRFGRVSRGRAPSTHLFKLFKLPGLRPALASVIATRRHLVAAPGAASPGLLSRRRPPRVCSRTHAPQAARPAPFPCLPAV